MFIKLHTLCFSTVFYTVKHVLSEIIEIVPPNHIWYLRFLTPEYVSGVLIFLIAYFPPQFSLAGVFWRYEHIRSGLDIVRCPVIETISFSTAHQSRFSLSPVLSEDCAIYSAKSWFCSAWEDGYCPNQNIALGRIELKSIHPIFIRFYFMYDYCLFNDAINILDHSVQ